MEAWAKVHRNHEAGVVSAELKAITCGIQARSLNDEIRVGRVKDVQWKRFDAAAGSGLEPRSFCLFWPWRDIGTDSSHQTDMGVGVAGRI